MNKEIRALLARADSREIAIPTVRLPLFLLTDQCPGLEVTVHTRGRQDTAGEKKSCTFQFTIDMVHSVMVERSNAMQSTTE